MNTSMVILQPVVIDNDASVNIFESMAALQLNSVAAHKYYNKTSGISETCEYKALGLIKK